MNRTIKVATDVILGLALIVFFMGTAPAQAQQDGNWTILEISGDVEIDRGGNGIAPVSVDSRLGEGSVIRTRDRGRLVLIRGDESIIVGPNTEISIPEQDKSWGTRILQSLGTALFKVQKKSSPHFEVVTPYMAAVVKGTSFTVNVREGTGLVHVLEGAVQVTDVASGAAVMVRPGQTARTSSGIGLQLDGAPVDNGTEATQTDSAVTVEDGTPDVAPSETLDAGTEGGTSAATVEVASGAVLSAPVGLVKIDISSATNGLVRSAEASGGRGAAKSSSNGNANGNGRGNGAVSARSAVESARVSDRSATARSGNRAAIRTALASANGNSGNNGNGNSGNNGNGNSGNNGNGNSGNNGNGNSGNNGNGNSGNNGNGNSGNNGNGNSGNNGNGNSGNNGNGNSGNNGNGNSGNNGNGNSGNNGNGNSGSSGNGNSGNSGNGNSGNSGNGNSGNSGNGNSGNSGNGNSGNNGNGNGKNN